MWLELKRINMEWLKIIIGLFIVIGLIGLGGANGYFNQAYWHSEALWLEEDDFDEEVDRLMRCGNLSLKISILSFIIAGVLVAIYWFYV